MNRIRSVLIVDDDELSREVLSILLAGEGYQVAGAASGEEALALLSGAARRGDLPDVILTDLHMPGLAGRKLARQLRDLCGPSAHLLIMSAALPEAAVTAAYDGFLRKPLSVEDLAQALQGLPASVEARREPPACDAAPILEEATYSSLTAMMPAQQVEEIYSLCLSDARRRIASMRIALSQGDLESVCRQSHLLRGGCGMVGATEIRLLAAALEDLGLDRRTPAERETLLDRLAHACERLRHKLELRRRQDA